MFDGLASYSIQQTSHGWVVTFSNGNEDEANAWTARTIEAATASIVNDFYVPKPKPTKGN